MYCVTVSIATYQIQNKKSLTLPATHSHSPSTSTFSSSSNYNKQRLKSPKTKRKRQKITSSFMEDVIDDEQQQFVGESPPQRKKAQVCVPISLLCPETES